MNPRDPERWQRIEAVLTAALEATPEQRAGLLDRLCAGEVELRREVESLLEAHEAAGEFLGSAAGAFAAPYLAELPDDSPQGDGPGTLVGRYRLVEELGRGGMGTVWLAERADGQFEQRVALKLIKRGMDTEEILARFLRERQILARLTHRDIARLLDGGVSDDDRPYFVMEQADGMPITRYCDRRRLPIDERLRLFGRVCRAVQYAHRNLVVHRDIKPSNVLVTESGEVRLLDFGVARLLSEDGTGGGEPTLAGGSATGPMTPEYASPEQLAGQPVTTASDVYQLGILLYEMLTGHRPYRFLSRDRREVERVVREVEPTRPSSAVGRTEQLLRGDGTAETIAPDGVSGLRRTTPERLRRRLRGDLDGIALRALRKEPEQRQPSAEALAEDVDRHLAYLPIRYGGGGWRYGAVKFLRRYRVGVAAAALVAISGSGFGALYLSRIRAERDRALREAAKAWESAALLRRFFEGWSPDAADRGEVSAETVLHDAARRAERELSNDPEMLASTFSMLGDLHSALGQTARADSLLGRALAIQERLSDRPSADLAATLARRGRLLLRRGRYQDGEGLLRRALSTYLAVRRPEQAEVLMVESDLAEVLSAQEKLEEGERLFRDALGKAGSADAPLATEIAAELGYTLFLQARYDEASEILAATLERQRRIFGRRHGSTFRTMRYLGSALRDKGALDDALALGREALEISRSLYGEAHLQTRASLVTLALVLERKGAFAEAGAFAERARRPEGRGGERSLEGVDVIGTGQLRTLGAISLALGDSGQAEALLRRALREFSRAYPQGHSDEGDVLNRLAAILVARRARDAAEIYLRATRFEASRPPTGAHFVTDGYEYLAEAARLKGDLPLAERLYRRALALYEAQLPKGHLYRVQTAAGLRRTLLDAGRGTQAAQQPQ